MPWSGTGSWVTGHAGHGSQSALTDRTSALFQVSFLPRRGSGSFSSSGELDDDEFTSEHRRLQRTPTPYYEEAPSLLTTDIPNVDEMEATDSVEGSLSGTTEDSVTDMSGRTADSAVRQEVTFSYDGDDDDDGDEEEDEDICRELAQLN